MGKNSLIGLGLLLVLFLVGICSPQGMGNTKADTNYYDWMGTPVIAGDQGKLKVPDWLSPSSDGRPDWDPYGPGSTYSTYYPALGISAWDPYAPSVGRSILRIEPADPAAEGLTIQGNLRTPNQLYLQRDGFLVSNGRVSLGEPYVLWASVGYGGNFVLYDNGETALAQSYLRPGWYRITGLYSEILSSHLYRFTSAGLASNELPVLVDAGSYLTGFGLTGRVVDPSGRGIAGAKVVISGSEGGVFTTTTNAQGYYGFDAPSGTYSITAELPGYSFTPSTARVWTGTVSVAQIITGYPSGSQPTAQPAAPQSAAQPAAAAQYNAGYGTMYNTGYNTGYNAGYGTSGSGWVQGRIREQAGGAIPFANLRVDGLSTSVQSDAQGNYVIALSPGSHRLDAYKPGYGIPPRAVLVTAGQTSNLDLIGKRTSTIGSGR